MGACEALLRVDAGKLAGLLLVVGRDGRAEVRELVLHVEPEHVLLDLVVLRERVEASLELLVQLVLDEGGEARTCGNALELVDRVLDLRRREEPHAVDLDLAEVARLEDESLHALLEPLELGRIAVGAGVAVREAERGHEGVPGHGLRVRLAERGQHGVDVAHEHLVGREEEDLRGVERGAHAVEEVGDALEHDARLARACDAGDEQHRHVLVAHDDVLLALDRRGDGAELLGVVGLERRQQERVLDGDGGVEVAPELVAHDVELAALQQLHGARPAVHEIAHLAHLLVVVGLGDGAAPVDDERHVVGIGHARRPDVDVARRPAGGGLEDDLREVGLAQQQDGAPELVELDVVVLVVGVDDAVQGLDGGERLHGLVGAVEVEADLLAHVDEVLRRALVAALEAGRELVADALELGVDLGEMRLLLFEHLVHHASTVCRSSKKPAR